MCEIGGKNANSLSVQKTRNDHPLPKISKKKKNLFNVDSYSYYNLSHKFYACDDFISL